MYVRSDSSTAQSRTLSHSPVLYVRCTVDENAYDTHDAEPESEDIYIATNRTSLCCAGRDAVKMEMVLCLDCLDLRYAKPKGEPVSEERRN